MPQMAPLNWLALMTSFITVLIAFNVINFFNPLMLPKQSTATTLKYSISWKW